MWEARNRRSSDRRLEARLRSARPEANDALVRTIAGAVEPRRAPRAWSRVAFAGAFTTLLVGMFASFGGISYAASGATSAVHTLTKIAKAEKVVVHHSSAVNQYASPREEQAPASETQGAEAAQGVQAVSALGAGNAARNNGCMAKGKESPGETVVLGESEACPAGAPQ